MDEQELKLIEQCTNAATPEPWDWAYREFGTPEEAREWLGKMFDYNSANLFIHGAAHMEDGSHAPPVLEDVWAFVMPMISGNGPTSEANAKFCCMARSAVPLLISEVKQQRSDLIAVRKRAERAEAAADRAALEQLKNAFHETERKRQEAVSALERARALLAEFYDPSPCRFDHHGNCQEHNSTSYPCIMQRVSEALGDAR